MRKLYIFGLIGLAALIISLAWAEQITLSTYYPAPYGVYREMVTAHRLSIGDVNGDAQWNSDDMAVDQEGNPLPGSLTIANNVGIGTTSPEGNLHVNSVTTQGKIRISGVSDAGATYSALYFEDGNPPTPENNSWVIGYRNDVGLGTEKSLVFGRYRADGSNFIPMMINPSGNVGIGTISPQTYRGLSIKGHIWASDGDPGSGHEAFVMYKPDNNIDPASKFYFRKGTGPNLGSGANAGVDLMRIDNNGNVWALGPGNVSSDKRLKINIVEIDKTLSKILHLKPIKYDRLEMKTNQGRIEIIDKIISKDLIGLIAQDVYEIIPEVVIKPEDELKDSWSISYDQLIPILIKGIQEQQTQIAELAQRIKQLEKSAN